MSRADLVLDLAKEAIDEFVDAIELWVEDQDEPSSEFLQEMTRYIFDEVSVVALIAVIDCQGGKL